MIRLRKVTYLIHVDQIDAEGNVIGEGVIAADAHGNPRTAWPHQIDQIAAEVAASVAANQPTDEAPA